MGKTLLILVGGDLLIALMAHHFGLMVRSESAFFLKSSYQTDILRVFVFAFVLLLSLIHI